MYKLFFEGHYHCTNKTYFNPSIDILYLSNHNPAYILGKIAKSDWEKVEKVALQISKLPVAANFTALKELWIERELCPVNHAVLYEPHANLKVCFLEHEKLLESQVNWVGNNPKSALEEAKEAGRELLIYLEAYNPKGLNLEELKYRYCTSCTGFHKKTRQLIKQGWDRRECF